MSRLKVVRQQELQRTIRVRSQFTGTEERPRLSVSISNRHITAQIINDEAGKTLVYVSTVGKKKLADTMTKQAADIGLELSKKAKAANISKVVFDRGSRKYHGRIKALAEAAREGGLEF
jgi:large subunit ribosomal protein L18